MKSIRQLNGRIIDIFFKVTGKQVPVDHGYALFGAISRILEAPDNQWLHGNSNIGLHLIRGIYNGYGKLLLTSDARIGLRLPVELLPKTLKLVGNKLDLDGYHIRVGVSHSTALIPKNDLYARIVTTKNGADPERFDTEIRRQMDVLDIRGKPLRIFKNRDKDRVSGRRVFRVGSKTIVGYSLLITELNAQESIRLQEHGLGGRRRMGCGVFVPTEGMNV